MGVTLSSTILASAGGVTTQRVPTVAWAGDSLTAWAKNTSGSTSQYTAVMYPNFLRRLLRNRMQTSIALNFAVAAQKTDHFLSTQVPSIIAALTTGDICFVQVGTNDVGVNTAATAIANVTSAVTQLTAKGITVILLAIAPQSPWNSTKRQQAAQMNRAYAKLALTYRLIQFCDINEVYTDFGSASGDCLSGYQYSDGIHDSPAGSSAKGHMVYDKVSNLFPAVEYSDFAYTADFSATLCPDGNLINNPIMKGSGVGGLVAFGSAAAPTGLAADNLYCAWGSSTATTATAAFSKTTHPTISSLPAQAIAMGGTGDSNYLRVRAMSVFGTPGVTIPGTLPVGKSLVFESDLWWSSLAGIKAIEIYLSINDGTTTYIVEDGALFTPGGTSDLALPATFPASSSYPTPQFRTPAIVCPAAITSISAELRIVPISGASLAGSVNFTRWQLRAID